MRNTRMLVLTGVFSAIAYILMLLEFPLAFIMPSFIKFDISEIPGLICSFAAGPLWGMLVCLIKNLIHLLNTSTNGVGELANFILGACFVLPAGIIYKRKKTKKGAFYGVIAGTLTAAIISLPVNLFITYPFYMNFMPLEAILGAYRAFIPNIQTLPQALLIFNVPFNIFKYGIAAAITFACYKRISPLFAYKAETNN